MTIKNIPDSLGGFITKETIMPLSMISKSTLNPAEWMYERIVCSINDFEEALDHDHEVGARLVTFGANVTFHPY
ncbi:MAG: hypothetical protein KKA60_13695 [Proteobacteria bacterium]|nr:hypothetical protein [Pseudomonadota bacterium]